MKSLIKRIKVKTKRAKAMNKQILKNQKIINKHLKQFAKSSV